MFLVIWMEDILELFEVALVFHILDKAADRGFIDV
jgi:hypothetical protein